MFKRIKVQYHIKDLISTLRASSNQNRKSVQSRVNQNGITVGLVLAGVVCKKKSDFTWWAVGKRPTFDPANHEPLLRGFEEREAYGLVGSCREKLP